MSLKLDPMVFDSLEYVTVPVTIAGENYELREASGEAKDTYDRLMMSGASFSPSEKRANINMANLAGAGAVLLSHCLFESKSGRAVPLRVINSWPDRIRQPLIERLKEISLIDTASTEEEDEQLEEALGNLSSGTTDGSE